MASAEIKLTLTVSHKEFGFRPGWFGRLILTRSILGKWRDATVADLKDYYLISPPKDTKETP